MKNEKRKRGKETGDLAMYDIYVGGMRFFTLLDIPIL